VMMEIANVNWKMKHTVWRMRRLQMLIGNDEWRMKCHCVGDEGTSLLLSRGSNSGSWEGIEELTD
jgi:hypothetical protein